jgi:hypothetical protein
MLHLSELPNPFCRRYRSHLRVDLPSGAKEEVASLSPDGHSIIVLQLTAAYWCVQELHFKQAFISTLARYNITVPEPALPEPLADFVSNLSIPWPGAEDTYRPGALLYAEGLRPKFPVVIIPGAKPLATPHLSM